MVTFPKLLGVLQKVKLEKTIIYSLNSLRLSRPLSVAPTENSDGETAKSRDHSEDGGQSRGHSEARRQSRDLSEDGGPSRDHSDVDVSDLEGDERDGVVEESDGEGEVVELEITARQQVLSVLAGN